MLRESRGVRGQLPAHSDVVISYTSRVAFLFFGLFPLFEVSPLDVLPFWGVSGFVRSALKPCFFGVLFHLAMDCPS